VCRATLALAETRTQANRVALLPTSTLDEVKAEYFTTLSYASANDSALAARFVVAAEMLLIMLPKRASRESESAEWNTDAIVARLAAAEGWIAAYNPARSITRMRTITVEDFRR
jgi:hypothetical protein